MAEKFLFYGAVYLLLRDGSNILLARRQNTGHEDGNFGLVAGHIEAKETAAEAMAREAREEIGIEISPADLKTVHVMHRNAGEREYFDVVLEASSWKGEIKNLEPEKCSELTWFAESALPENTINYISFVLKKIQSQEHFSSFGFEG